MKKVLFFLMIALTCFTWGAKAQQALPYSYGFEDNDLSADGWIAQNLYSSSIYTSAAKTGSYGFGFEYTDAGYLVSPILTGGTNGVVVSFYYKAYSSSYPDHFKVGYTTDASVTDPSEFTYGNLIYSSSIWQQYEETFPAGTVRIAIWYDEDNYSDGWYLYLDDFTFAAPASCVKPTALAATNITAESATLGWTAPATAPSNGYNVRYRIAEVQNPYFFDDFEDGLTQWTIYTDGEAPQNNGWYTINPQNGLDFVAYSGTYCASSWSWNSSAYDANNWLVTPQVTLAGTLKFYVRTNPSYPDEYEVLLSTTGNAEADFTVTLQAMATAPATGEWEEVSIDLSTYSGNGYIAIHHVDNNNNYLLIDDFGIYGDPTPAGEWVPTTSNTNSKDISGLTENTTYEFEVQSNCGGGETSSWVASTFTTLPSCMPVADLEVSATTTTSVSLTWTDQNDGLASYIITDGDNNSVTVTNPTATGCTVTGLTANTAYTFKVSADCGSTVESIQARTDCDALTELPYEEDFEASSVNIYCWDVDGFNRLNNNTYAHNGSVSLYSGAALAYAILPATAETNISDLMINFYWRNYYAGYDAGTLYVGYVIDASDNSTFVPTGSIDMSSSISSYTLSDNFTFASAPEGSRMAFKYVSSNNDYSYVFIDDITVQEVPNCLEPNSLNVTASGQTATFTWGSDATEWQVAHATSATAEPNDNIVTSTPINTTNYSMEDLALDEDHYFWVRTYCGAAEQSEWAGPVSVHIGYCVPTLTSTTTTYYISRFTTSGATTNIDNETTGAGASYSNFYDTYSASAYPGLTIDFTITISGGSSYGSAIWVDWNNDMEFSTDERVYNTTSYTYSPHTGSFTVPTTANIGNYRMRIVSDYYSSNPSNPCSASTGEFEDYKLTITEVPSCLTPTALTLSRDNDQITATWEGSASTYNIDINGTVTNNVTSPHTFTADLSTIYTVKVQANCGDETSDWSNPQSITTPDCWAGRIINYTLIDSYNDGWNGAAIYVKEGCDIVCTLTVSNGLSPNNGTLELCGDYYEFIWKSGSYDSECSFTFKEGETTLFTKPSTVSNGLVLYTIGTLTCPAPTNLVKETPAARSVVLNWTENGEATQWVVAYKTATADGFSELVVTENPYTLENLDPETPYVVKVRANCSSDDVSCWSNSVNFTTPVACPAPTALAAGTPGPDHVQLSWTKNGSETAWQIAYKAGEDFDPTDEADLATATIVDADENPFTIEGLQPETTYYAYVRANCGGIDGTSAWEGYEDFTTAANCPTPVLAANAFSDISGHAATVTWTGFTQNSNYTVWYRVPEHINGLVEEFNTSSIPTDWTRSNTPLTDDVLNGTTSLNSYTSGWNFGTANGVFDSHARMNIYGTSKYWLVSPKVTLSTNSLLSFDLALTAYSGTLAAPGTTGTDDRFVVLISADEGSTWTILRQWDNNPGSTYVYNDIASSATGENVEFDLSAYDGNDVKIAFYGESTASNADNNLHIDNVAIGTLIPATTWQTKDVPAPDPFTSTPSTTITGLDPETTYEVKVTANCVSTEAGESAIQSFTTDVKCPAPTNLTFESATTNSATVKWNSPSDINSWYVYYKAKGAATFNSMNVNNSTTTIPDLLPGTIYVVKVTADCSTNNDGESDESDSITFATGCVVIEANGYTENFDDNTTVDNNGLPVCWSSINETTYNSEKSYPTISSSSSYNTPNCLRFYSTYASYYGNSNPQPQYAILPQMTGLGDNLRIKFQAKGYNANSTFKIGRMTDPTDATTFTLITEQTGLTTSYQEFVYNITGNGDYLAIMIDAANGDRTANGVYIDTILIEPIPSCVEPSDLAVVGEEGNPGTNSVKLSWTPGGTEDVWDIYYSTTNTVPTETTEPSVSVTNNPETVVDGLDAATTYYVWVRAHCSDADKSPWIGGISFTTEFCAAADQCDITIKLTDSYGDGWNGNSMQVIDNQTNILLGTYTLPSSTSEQTFTLSVCNGREINFVYVAGGSYQYENGWSITDVNGEVITEEEVGNPAPTAGVVASYTVNCAITDCKKPTDLAYTELKNHSVKLSWTDNVEATAWVVAYKASSETNFTEVNVTTNPYTLTGLAAETDYTVKVRPVCDDDFIKWSDEVTFTTLEACPAPTNFEVTSVNYINNITFNSAELGWNVGDDTQTAWQIAYKAGEDFDPTDEADLATATIVDADENPFTIEGLQPETTYYAYVRANCSATDKSNWSNVDYFTTLERCPAPGSEGEMKDTTQTSVDLIWYLANSDKYNVRYRTAAYYDFSFTEDFEDGEMPDGWTTDGLGSWSVGTGDYSSSTGAGEGMYNAKINHGTTGNATKLITPVIDLSAVTNPMLSFMHVQRSWSGDNDELRVYYRTSSTESWTLLDGQVYTSAVSSWTTENNITLPNPSSTYQIAFEMTDGYGYGVGIDSVTIVGGEYHEAGEWDTVFNVSYESYIAPDYPDAVFGTLGGLNPGTAYEAQVQANCTDDEGESTSEWSYSYEFTTLPPYIVTVEFTPSDAVITMSGAGEYTDGQTAHIAPENATGYHIVNWTDIDGLELGTGDYIDIVVVSDTTIIANFDTNVYNVDIILVGPGTENNFGDVDGPATIKHFLDADYTATPEYGYLFQKWTDEAGTELGTNEVLNIAAVSDTTVKAVFVYDTFAIAGVSADDAMGTVSGSNDKAPFHSNVELTATPELGYRFVEWIEADTLYSDIATISVAVIGNRTLTAYFEQIDYSITATVDPDGAGSVTGTGTEFHYGGTPAHLTAVPEAGWQFQAWIEADSTYSEDSEIDVDITLSNREFIALFTQIEYNITADADPWDGGSVIFEAGPFYYGGDPAHMEAVPYDGWRFVNWTEADTVYSTDSEISVDITLSDRSFIAHFEQIDYSITATVDPANSGSVEVPVGPFHFGDDPVTLTATAAEGYTFVNWTEADTVYSTDSEISVDITTSDREFVAHFDTLEYSISAERNPEAGGEVTGAGTYKHFKTATLTATANYGYHFVNWTNEAGEPLGTDATITIQVVSDSTITANFAVNTYLVNVSINPAGSGDVYGTAGTATFVPGDPYAYGTQISLTAVPDENKEFVNWTENGVSVSTDNPYEFELTAARSLTANFKNMDQVAIPDFNPAAGTIFLHHSQNQTVTLSCETEDAVIYYTTDGTTPTANSTAYTNGITVNNGTEVTIKAIAMKTGMQNSGISTATYKIVPLYDVTISDAISHGSASADHQTAAKDSVVKLTATPAEHYHFDSWHVTSGNDVITVTNNQFTMPAGNVVVSAIFELDTFQVNVTVNPDNTGSVTGTVGAATTSTTAFENGAYYAYNTHITLTATPATNKEFEKWTENGQLISTDATLAFDLDGARNLVANFKNMGQVEAPTFSLASGTYFLHHDQNQTVTLSCTTPNATIYYTTDGTAPTANSTAYTDGITVQNGTEVTINAIAMKEGMINSEVSTATYNIVPLYDVTISDAISHGSASADHQTAAKDSVVKLTATPAEHYHFDSWHVTSGNNVITVTNNQFTMPAGNVVVSAIFELDTFQVNVTVNPDNTGSVTGTVGAATTSTTAFENGAYYAYNTHITLTATPATNKEFVSWTEGGVEISTNATIAFDVTAERNLVANFKAMGQVEAPTFQPVAGTYHEAQSVTINCATEGATIYYTMDNSEPTINSTPYTGAITTTSNGIDTIKAIAVKEGMVNSEVSVAVYEIIPQYTITVAANPTESGDVGGDGTYNHGESVTLEVVAVEEGYTFNNWTLNGNVVSEDPYYTFDVTADGHYVANFTQNTYEITVSANPQNGGTVFGGGTYIHGETATLIATPSTATGYTFNNWTLNGNVVSEDPSYTFYVTADGDYVANFTLNTQTLTIHYQYEDGTAVGDDTVKQVNIGSTYNVVSPEIDCYVADKLNVTGTMGVEEVKDTVTYTSLATTGIDERVVCDSLKWIDGTTYHQSTNTPTYTLVNVAGCDSVVTLHLTINASPAEPVLLATDNTSCENPNGSIEVTAPLGTGITYSMNGGAFQSETTFEGLSTGTYTITAKNAAGCTSKATAPITTTTSDLSVEVSANPTCEGGDLELTATPSTSGVTYSWTGPNNFTSTEQNPVITGAGADNAGTYTVVVTETATSCTASNSAEAVVSEPSTSEEYLTECDSVEWNGTTYYQSTEETVTLSDVAGCDSLVTLHLTINYSTTGDTTATACESFVWYGETLTQSGEYTHTFAGGNAAGCDSVVTLNLTINQSTTGDTAATACESFVWYGETLTQSGEYTHTFVGGNAAGCDSVVTLNLTINQNTTGDDYATICESELPYTWQGETFTEAGNKDITLASVVTGCDSVVTLHLTVNETTYGIDEQFACDSLTWINGITYYQSTNEPTDTIFGGNVAGCDSVITLHLTIYHAVSTELKDTICASTNYNNYGFNISMADIAQGENVFTDTLETSHGCDSVVILKLFMQPCIVACGEELVDVDNNHYPTKAFGNVCWMMANLRATHYTNGTEIPFAIVYVNPTDNTTVDETIFGRLYSWASASAAPNSAPNSAVLLASPNAATATPQYTICPVGWRLPTSAELQQLNVLYTETQLRSTDNWIVNPGNNESGFNKQPAGFYNAATGRCEGLGTSAHFYTSDYQSNAGGLIYQLTEYYCNEPFYRLSTNPDDGRSIRCVREIED